MLRQAPPDFSDLTPAEQVEACREAAELLEKCGQTLRAQHYARVADEIEQIFDLPGL